MGVVVIMREKSLKKIDCAWKISRNSLKLTGKKTSGGGVPQICELEKLFFFYLEVFTSYLSDCICKSFPSFFHTFVTRSNRTTMHKPNI